MVEYTSSSDIDLSKGVYIIEFYANWCGTCRQVTKSMEALEPKYPYIFLRVNTETQKPFTMENHVQGVPIILVYKDGVERNRSAGSKTISELKYYLDSLVFLHESYER